MSMDEASVEGGGTDVGPAETGDAAPEAPAQQTEAPPPRQYVEVDDPDNRWERVKVDDEDVEIPYSELKRGYSRHADYTRKTQELANQRQEADYGIRLQRALEANPELTIQLLAQQYGFGLGDQQQAQVPDEPEYTDPLERAVNEERQARMALEERIAQREADDQLRQAVGMLRSQFKLSDEDVNEVVSTAFQMRLGFDAFPMIAKTIAFDRLQARVQQQAQTRQEEEQRRQAAAVNANQLVGTGQSAANLTSQVDADGHMNLREAIEAAIAQVEG